MSYEHILVEIRGKVELSSGMLRSVPFDQHGDIQLH